MKTLAYTGIFTLLVFWGVKAHAQNVPAVRHYNQTTLGGAYGIGNVKYIDKGDAVRRRNKEWYAEFTTVNGVQYKNHQFGLGIGANIWKTKWFVPIFLQYKATFTNRKAKPYGSLDVGFSFGPERFNKQFSAFETNYLFLKPAFGIEVKLGKKTAWWPTRFTKCRPFAPHTCPTTYGPFRTRCTTIFWVWASASRSRQSHPKGRRRGKKHKFVFSEERPHICSPKFLGSNTYKTMSVKLRLQRHGRKQRPFYHIVAADSRSPRDGRFIERVGSYNPISEPATVVLDVEKAVKWLQNGAIPTDTVRGILSNEGVLYKNHLQTGVRKGAITQEQADEKFGAWATDKEARTGKVLDNLRKAEEAVKAARLAGEKETFNKRAAALAAAAAPPVEEVAEEAAPEAEAAAEETTEPAGE